MAKRATKGREKELNDALDHALLALWDIAGLCALLRDDETIGQADFPETIASAIRMIDYRATSVVKLIEVAQ